MQKKDNHTFCNKNFLLKHKQIMLLELHRHPKMKMNHKPQKRKNKQYKSLLCLIWTLGRKKIQSIRKQRCLY